MKKNEVVNKGVGNDHNRLSPCKCAEKYNKCIDKNLKKKEIQNEKQEKGKQNSFAYSPRLCGCDKNKKQQDKRKTEIGETENNDIDQKDEKKTKTDMENNKIEQKEEKKMENYDAKNSKKQQRDKKRTEKKDIINTKIFKKQKSPADSIVKFANAKNVEMKRLKCMCQHLVKTLCDEELDVMKRAGCPAANIELIKRQEELENTIFSKENKKNQKSTSEVKESKEEKMVNESKDHYYKKKGEGDQEKKELDERSSKKKDKKETIPGKKNTKGNSKEKELEEQKIYKKKTFDETKKMEKPKLNDAIKKLGLCEIEMQKRQENQPTQTATLATPSTAHTIRKMFGWGAELSITTGFKRKA